MPSCIEYLISIFGCTILVFFGLSYYRACVMADWAVRGGYGPINLPVTPLASGCVCHNGGASSRKIPCDYVMFKIKSHVHYFLYKGYIDLP